jgi:hypothetical protein
MCRGLRSVCSAPTTGGESNEHTQYFVYVLQASLAFSGGLSIPVMAPNSGEMAKIIKGTGVRGLIRFVRETIASPWLNDIWLKEKFAAPFQMRLT